MRMVVSCLVLLFAASCAFADVYAEARVGVMDSPGWRSPGLLATMIAGSERYNVVVQGLTGRRGSVPQRGMVTPTVWFIEGRRSFGVSKRYGMWIKVLNEDVGHISVTSYGGGLSIDLAGGG